MLFIITHPFLCECSFHHMSMHLVIQCVSYSYLILLGFHHFVTYILDSLTLHVCQTYGSICTSHEALIIVRLSDSYLTKIMWYKTYGSYKYSKISISIYVGNIIFECLFTYDLCINRKFGKGNPILNPLDNNTFLFIQV